MHDAIVLALYNASPEFIPSATPERWPRLVDCKQYHKKVNALMDRAASATNQEDIDELIREKGELQKRNSLTRFDIDEREYLIPILQRRIPRLYKHMQIISRWHRKPRSISTLDLV